MRLALHTDGAPLEVFVEGKHLPGTSRSSRHGTSEYLSMLADYSIIDTC